MLSQCNRELLLGVYVFFVARVWR
eukprot:COSAG05_NODE_20355_length_280_cov_0.574586_1_plen_23_part_10